MKYPPSPTSTVKSSKSRATAARPRWAERTRPSRPPERAIRPITLARRVRTSMSMLDAHAARAQAVTQSLGISRIAWHRPVEREIRARLERAKIELRADAVPHGEERIADPAGPVGPGVSRGADQSPSERQPPPVSSQVNSAEESAGRVVGVEQRQIALARCAKHAALELNRADRAGERDIAARRHVPEGGLDPDRPSALHGLARLDRLGLIVRERDPQRKGQRDEQRRGVSHRGGSLRGWSPARHPVREPAREARSRRRAFARARARRAARPPWAPRRARDPGR